MLAHKQNNMDAIRILCDHGANPKFRPFPNYPSPYELAILSKNREILKVYIQTN
jgi:ankyrin repeat protein